MDEYRKNVNFLETYYTANSQSMCIMQYTMNAKHILTVCGRDKDDQ